MENFNESSMYIIEKKADVIEKIVQAALKRSIPLIVRLFFVPNAKNNWSWPWYFKEIYINKIMPNTVSAIRRVRRVAKQTAVNRLRKSKYKSAIKKMETLIKAGEKDKIKSFFPEFQSILMKVAKTGSVNKKTASRKISKISKKIKN